MQRYHQKLIFRTASILLFLWILQGCASQNSCFILEPCITREVPLSLEEAKKLEYPLYLPPSETLKSLNFQETPVISRRAYDELCQYLVMEFNAQDTSGSGILIRISNGCDSAYITQSMYIDELSLSWAEDETAYLLEEDDIERLIFEEQTQGIRYYIFSEKTLSETMLFLESMELVSTD